MWISAQGTILAVGMKVRTKSGSEGVIQRFFDCLYCPKPSFQLVSPGRTRGNVIVSVHTDSVTEVWVTELWAGMRFYFHMTPENTPKCAFLTHSLERAKKIVSELHPSETPIDWRGDDIVSGQVPGSLAFWILQKAPIQ